ncbi:MAG: 1-phosphofructokinase family hexose kinase [Propioniciclava sp.]
MIVTFTANPSLDRTALLAGPLEPNGVNHVVSSSVFPGGRGFHLSAALARAGHPTLAVMPAMVGGPLEERLRGSGVPHQIVPIARPVRTNVTVSHEGSATIVREPGTPLEPETITSMVSAMMANSPGASWVVLCGSLPPGAPHDLYSRLCQIAHGVGARVAVQSTGQTLETAVAAEGECRPDLLALNARQLTQLTTEPMTGSDEAQLATAARGVRGLIEAGIPRVLVTLGRVGGIVGGPEGSWHARSEAIPVVTATGRGATALAGYLMARQDGATAAEALSRAMSYGTARTMLEGSRTPSPEDADAVYVHTTELPG